LKSGKVNYWTGPRGMEFERKFARWQGSRYTISTVTGTAALHVALTALGIGPGDEVIVPSYTFIVMSFSVVQAGAISRFADVNTEDHCISVESAEKLINERTKAIIPVHLYGNVCDMDRIMAFAEKHNLWVIEDNAEAFGGEYKGRKTGTIGHVAAASFCQNKTFTTGGEGGMVTTDDEDIAWTARSFRDHGYDVRERLNLLEMEQKLPYIHNIIGWNYRMTEMQSAIGLAELERIDTWNFPMRRRNAQILIDRLENNPQVKYFPVDTPERRNGWYVMAFSLDIENMNCDITQFVAAVVAEGAPCWKVFWPQCHTEKAFTEKKAFGKSGFPFTSREYTDPESVDYSKVEVPNAVWHESHTFTCFAFPTFTQEDMNQIADALEKVTRAFPK
jgi:dTDP-4-amino-4,6-dideoxygalactose transaminase